MARKPDIQYIRFYTDGSAARQPEFIRPRRKKTALPEPQEQKVRLVHVDPLALGGIVISVIMLVMMIAGSVQLQAVRQQEHRMRSYVEQLQARNEQLQNTYDTGYNIADVEQAARAIGMVPRADVTHICIDVSEPEPVVQLSFWQRLAVFFTGLFA